MRNTSAPNPGVMGHFMRRFGAWPYVGLGHGLGQLLNEGGQREQLPSERTVMPVQSNQGKSTSDKLKNCVNRAVDRTTNK